MARKSSNSNRTRFVFVHSNDLDSVKLDKDEKVDDAETLLELLQAPIGDACLIALRRILTLTYVQSPEPTSETAVRDIRGLTIKPLGELGKELEALKLARVDADRSFEHDRSAQVFQYNIVPAKELRRQVRVEGGPRLQSLDEIFICIPADPAIRELREILSMTFREATTPRQLDRNIEDIRYAAAEVLVPSNTILEQIELEPVAMPTWRRFVNGVDTLDGSDDDAIRVEVPPPLPLLQPQQPPTSPDRRFSSRWNRW